MEMILSGRHITGQNAMSMGKRIKFVSFDLISEGLVSKTFLTVEDLMAGSISLAKKIAKNEINAIVESKRLMRSSKPLFPNQLFTN